MTKQIPLLLTISLLMTSCASILNQSHKKITIYTTEPSIIINNQDTTWTMNNKAHLYVLRQKEPLRIIASTDSLSKSLTVNSKNSFMYLANIFTNAGLGIFVDKSKAKRYAYPPHIYINSIDSTDTHFRYLQANSKGDLHLHIAVPFFNAFQLTPAGQETITRNGFWGLTVGFDYYHSKNKFCNLSISHVSSLIPQIPSTKEIPEQHELITSSYISLSNNHKHKRFSIGYGLSYSQYTWDYRDYIFKGTQPRTREAAKKIHQAVGLVFPVYFQKGEYLNLGLVYRPTLYRPELNNQNVYEHLISIDLAWKIRMNK